MTSKNRHTDSDAPSVRSLMVYEGRRRPGHWLGSLIYVRHPSVLGHYWMPIIPKGSLPKTSGGKTKVDMTSPSTPGKWLLKMERLAHCTVKQQLIAVNKEHAQLHCKQHLD